jgi:hypothetical protein
MEKSCTITREVYLDHDAIVFAWHDRQSQQELLRDFSQLKHLGRACVAGSPVVRHGVASPRLWSPSSRIAAAIRAFGLYFSEIREFGSKSVLPE